MTQEQVLKFLEERKGQKVTATEVVKGMPINHSSAFKNLRLLRNSHFINYEVILNEQNKMIYKYWVEE